MISWTNLVSHGKINFRYFGATEAFDEDELTRELILAKEETLFSGRLRLNHSLGWF